MESKKEVSHVGNRGLLSLSAPLAAEGLFLGITGFVDTWIASLVSDTAAAAAGAIFALIMIAAGVLASLTQGASILMAVALGAKDHSGFSAAAVALIVSTTVLGMLVSAVLLFAPGHVVSILNLSPTLAPIGAEYLMYVGGSLFLAEVAWSLGAILNVQGRTRESMATTVTTNVLRLVLSYILVRGSFGFPEMGIAGLGVGLVVARFLHVGANAFLVWRLDLWRDVVNFSRPVVLTSFRSIMRLGIPTALEPMAYHLAQGVIVAILAAMPVQHLATRSYAAISSGMFESILFSVGMALQILVGHQIGARDWTELRSKATAGIITLLKLGVIAGAVAIVFRSEIMKVFSDDTVVLTLGSKVLVLIALTFPIKALNVGLGSVIRAFGCTRFLAITTVTFMWILYIPMALLFISVLEMGVIGIWVAMLIDEVLRGCVLAWKYGACLRRKTTYQIEYTKG